GKFHPDLVFIECSQQEKVGDIWDGKSYSRNEKSIEELQEELFSRLMVLCDSKQDEAENFILKHKNTVGQRWRYQDKYERALTGEFSADERAAIITNYETARNAIRTFVDLIEFFRQTVDDWIVNGELQNADKAIKEAENFGEATTLNDIKTLLSNMGSESE
ncbi:MAG: hypothetical protein AAFZ92_07545, partial [Pseudomonadota bacterium]